MMFLAQGHRASGKQSKDLNSGRMDCQTHPSPLLTVPVVPPSSGFSEISTSKCWAPTVYQVPCWVCHLASSSVPASPRRECPHFTGEKGSEGKGVVQGQSWPPGSPVSPAPAISSQLPPPTPVKVPSKPMTSISQGKASC